MSAHERAHQRKPFNCNAWIVDDHGRLRDCEVTDISEGGARLALAEIGSVPETFELWLRQDGSVRRNCHARWQTGDSVGVQFLGRANPAG